MLDIVDRGMETTMVKLFDRAAQKEAAVKCGLLDSSRTKTLDEWPEFESAYLPAPIWGGGMWRGPGEASGPYRAGVFLNWQGRRGRGPVVRFADHPSKKNNGDGFVQSIHSNEYVPRDVARAVIEDVRKRAVLAASRQILSFYRSYGEPKGLEPCMIENNQHLSYGFRASTERAVHIPNREENRAVALDVAQPLAWRMFHSYIGMTSTTSGYEQQRRLLEVAEAEWDFFHIRKEDFSDLNFG